MQNIIFFYRNRNLFKCLYNSSLFFRTIPKWQDTSRSSNFLAMRNHASPADPRECVHIIFSSKCRANRIRDDKMNVRLRFRAIASGNMPVFGDSFADVTGCRRDANFFSRVSRESPRMCIYAFTLHSLLFFFPIAFSCCNNFIMKRDYFD